MDGIANFVSQIVETVNTFLWATPVAHSFLHGKRPAYRRGGWPVGIKGAYEKYRGRLCPHRSGHDQHHQAAYNRQKSHERHDLFRKAAIRLMPPRKMKPAMTADDHSHDQGIGMAEDIAGRILRWSWTGPCCP